MDIFSHRAAGMNTYVSYTIELLFQLHLELVKKIYIVL